MNLKVKSGRLEKEKTEALVLGLPEGGSRLPEEAVALDRALRGGIREVLASGDFSGKANQSLLLHTRGRIPSHRVLLVGLGREDRMDLETVRQAMGTAARCLRDLGIKAFTVPVPTLGRRAEEIEDRAQAVVEGCLLALYQFTVYQTEQRAERKAVEEIVLLVRSEPLVRKTEKGAGRGQILAESTNDARDLGNHPSNVVTPARLAEEAKMIANAHGLSCQVLERADAERLGMGSYLGVARGSQEPPKFIVLEYEGSGRKEAPTVLVGKSITFDSGGISLKPAEKMEQMKDDMAGGAAVLSTLKAAARLKLPAALVGILPAAENMPSGAAVKPGDILTSLSGRTIEVINTDAEGRLALADALAYATTRYKPAAVIDLATLTGACVVALGHHATGILGNNPGLIERIRTAGERCGERVWELPLWDRYFEQIKSDVADMKNVGGRPAGTITAAAFLSKFVQDRPWAHLDIAGTAWTDEAGPYTPKGATGVGVRLLIEHLTEGLASRGRGASVRTGRGRDRS
jgi:leucyl aminopeptidase